MAAGQGYIEFSTGDVLTAAAANGYLASQVVMVFASSAARTSAIASPQEGMISYLKDTNAVEYYSGSAWTAIGGGGGGATLVGCQLTKSASQSMSNATETAISFNGETWDTDAFHDNSTNNTRITIPSGKAGKYEFTAQVAIEGMNGAIYVLIKKNGSVWEYVNVMNATGSTSFNTNFTTTFLMNLSVADYVEMFIYQGSGSSKNCLTATTFGVNYLGA